MEPEQYTGSVIAQLMNLNGNPSFQPSTGPIRVLSDDYLQKTASIALHRSLSFQGSNRYLFRPDASQGSRKTKKRTLSGDNDCVASKRSLEEPKNAQNNPIVVKRAKSAIGRLKSSKQHPQITSDFRFAKKQPSSSLQKTATNTNVVFSYTDQETSPKVSNHLDEEEDEEDSLFLSSNCADYASPSPISVLEPCLSDNSKSTKSDIHGIHLEFLKSEYEETNSEDSGTMMVLSDDENMEQLIKDNRKLIESFGDQGSRDFSYIVDALDEAGFHGNETLSFELPIGTVIFEIMEKKYGEQKTWERWERKLLFDRMNLGLKDILHHHPCRSNSRQLAKRIDLWQRREVVEDELWAFLINQEKVKEKEAKLKVAEKVLYGTEGVEWLDLHDEIELLVAEIETSLFRELEAELLVC